MPPTTNYFEKNCLGKNLRRKEHALKPTLNQKILQHPEYSWKYRKVS
jgi:hypothetical protein